MHTFLTIGFIVTLFYTFIQFARQESIQDHFEEAVLDVEGRLDWAMSRRFFPFGMRAQLEVSNNLLDNAKALWAENKWDQAYHAALSSQKAMDRAQSIYSSVVKARLKAREDDKR